jgi:predicted CopG family antitoxin
MIKKNITYVDFNGEERTDAFYFNLSKAELMDIELDYNGNMSEAMNIMLEKRDMKGVLGLLSKLVRKAYGEKSGDGKRFLKNKELEDGFVTTDAFSNLLIELVNDEKKLEAFVAGVVPADMREEIEKRIDEKRDTETEAKPELKVVDKPSGSPIEMN